MTDFDCEEFSMIAHPRMYLTISLTALCVSLPLASSAQAGLPDKNLEAAVRAVIFEKKDKTDEITDDDLKKVFVLEARGKGIKDLTGLEKCVNLLQLNATKNEIVDVSPLKDIKNLQSLDLSHNKIVDV